MRRILSVLLLLLPLAAFAETEAQKALPPPPTLEPSSPEERELYEPKVKIIHDKDQTIEQYSLHGQVYMVRVIPKHGKPYYLVDSDGNGSLDQRSTELSPRLMIPSWVLFRW
ncbi:MAG: DUF2782 domain-containing protein [Gammaproteobacteria bacterium]|jgi:hypothetical protein